MKKTEAKLNAVYDYIKKCVDEKGFPPSYREIAKATGVKSTNSVKDYIDKLKNCGLIKTTDSKNRCIEIVSMQKELKNNMIIPLVGQVAAGYPILAEQNVEEEFSISSNLFGTRKSLFMLKVKGDSMINIGINNGDMVVVEKRNTAQNGDLVVAMINGEATVKNIYFEKDKIKLQPQNDKYQPIYTMDANILGKVIGLIKLF